MPNKCNEYLMISIPISGTGQSKRRALSAWQCPSSRCQCQQAQTLKTLEGERAATTYLQSRPRTITWDMAHIPCGRMFNNVYELRLFSASKPDKLYTPGIQLLIQRRQQTIKFNNISFDEENLFVWNLFELLIKA